MSVRRGLGRGLGALLGEERSAAPPTGESFRSIAVSAIRPNKQQPRQTFDHVALGELEQSIREIGVLVPVIVRELESAPGTFELIAGERRWRAASAAKLEAIPAIVRHADDRTSLELAVVENLQRQDLDPLEEAMGFAHLMDEYGFTQDRLAQRIGKSRPAVANALRLLGLSDALKALLRTGILSGGHARALLALPPAERESVAKRVERDGLTVRDIERLAAGQPPRRNARPKVASDADRQALESRLRYRLGAPVRLVGGVRGGGRLEIRYADDVDLSRIVDVLLPEDA